ncbi:Polyisoprenoid-binding protein YceI [Aquimarina amphilecti]|uniref:Polyisoprenoid-binding protein YceI n=1 Tax=Aquimarina amphilecti TaxID=1038014 RepID=A0A1H7T0N2_AQUAM|nr:YceI family protein [Aquimarina amphilecti]SEL78268.1 Polyisoprenoid-binding protein YceI [Aquimarina amphilecti]
MKTKLKPLLLALTLIATTSFYAQQKQINTAESTINWTGKKVTGQHTGTLSFSSGFLTFDNKNLSGGEFIVDMSSLAVTDLEAGKGKEKLEGHLNSDDFFGVQNFKNAKLIIKKATKMDGGYKIAGDLTIKGKTNPIAFELAVNGSTASATLNVDRTKYDIKYGSGSFFDNLGDKAISDEFELAVNLKM